MNGSHMSIGPKISVDLYYEVKIVLDASLYYLEK